MKGRGRKNWIYFYRTIATNAVRLKQKSSKIYEESTIRAQLKGKSYFCTSMAAKCVCCVNIWCLWLRELAALLKKTN